MINSSTLPNISYKTKKWISDFEIKEDDILLITKNFNPNKAYGSEKISIRLIQLFGMSIVTPLKYLFESYLAAGIYPKDWKKGNIFSVHGKESKTCLKNYRSINLFPIFSKIFKKLISSF